MTGLHGQGGPCLGLAAELTGTAPAGQASASSPAGLPPGARYLGRFVGMPHALVACGVPVAQALALAGRNRRPKPPELRHTLPGDAPRLAGCTLIVRRTPAHQAEAWAVCGDPTASEAPAPAAGQERA